MPRKPAAAAPVRARKNMDIDVDKLARARSALGAASDTETVDRALDFVNFELEVFGALDRLAAAGALADAYGREQGVARPRAAGRGRARASA